MQLSYSPENRGVTVRLYSKLRILDEFFNHGSREPLPETRRNPLQNRLMQITAALLSDLR
jgi:hypothetical protein